MKKWFAIYTRPRFEKKVASELEKRGIDHYLPLVKVLRQWSDRKKWVQHPLFSSYVFVNIQDEEYIRVLSVPGIVRFITFEKKRIAIPPLQIEAIKNFVDSGDYRDENVEEFEEGGLVEIIAGPLKGLTGKLIKRTGKHKVRIEIEGIHQFIYLNIPVSHLKVFRV